jgi:hypothetical protein
MAKRKKGKAGRPTKEPDSEQRKRIETLAGYGLTTEEIANVEKVDAGTLTKWCKEEITRGRSNAKALVINQLFGNIKKGKEASIFFWLKCQARWSEKAGDTPIANNELPTIIVNVKTPDRLKDE